MKLQDVVILKSDDQRRRFKIIEFCYDDVRIASPVFGFHWVNKSELELIDE